MPLLRGEHVKEEGTSTREVTVFMLHLRDDFALPLKPPTAFGYEPFSFGNSCCPVDTVNGGKNFPSRLLRVCHYIAFAAGTCCKFNNGMVQLYV